MTGAALALSYSPWREASALRRLVIVADSSIIMHAIQTAVCASGEFEFVGRVDPRTGTAETILGTEPDVVLLDDANHSAQVLELLREIRAHDTRLAVLMLGFDLGPEWLARAFGAGATAAISTATEPLALVTLVRETINGHIVHRALAGAALTLAAATAARTGGDVSSA
jgi:DNA-binding NarL/FixJ family response regulator